MKRIDGFAEEIGFQVAGLAREGAQARGAFRAAQVAGGGGFYAHRDGQTPLNGPFKPACEVIGNNHLRKIQHPPEAQFG